MNSYISTWLLTKHKGGQNVQVRVSSLFVCILFPGKLPSIDTNLYEKVWCHLQRLERSHSCFFETPIVFPIHKHIYLLVRDICINVINVTDQTVHQLV